MPDEASDVLEVSVHIEAPPERVFAFFTDPSRYVQWMGSTAKFEPHPGGVYRVAIRDGVEAVGEFLEIEPPTRLVFTWGWVNDSVVPPGSTRVVVTLAAAGGGTQVVLQHHDLPHADARAMHSQGWTMYLERLALVLAGEDPGLDPNSRV